MRTAVILAAGAAVIAVAPTAHADQYDFIGKLDAQGVYYRDISVMIDDGKIVCGQLRGAMTGPQVEGEVIQRGGFNAADAAIIIVSAVTTMC
ncbi:MAG: DUF732 domain-containing protein, partial [Mycobacterium sp.]